MADTFWAVGFWPDGFWADGFWTNEGAPEPAAEPTGQTPAGRARKRLYVEIDGQTFPVDSAAQAVELLQRARALAEQQAEKKSRRITKALRHKPVVPNVRIDTPAIAVSPELKADAAPLIADIERLYRRAAETAELRLLLMKQLEREQEDDDEDDVLLLI